MKWTVLSLVLLLLSCSSVDKKEQKFAKNVIYFIGDGMGPAQLTGGRMYRYGAAGSLKLEKMAVTGFSKTYSSDNYVTDSAAAGTALASGVKTYNGSIGMTDPMIDPSGKSRQLTTIVDLAKAMGKSVGIISTARVTHATPAAFFAHIDNREKENQIAAQLMNSSVDLVLGGGLRHFIPKDKGGKRMDQRDLIEEFKKANWQVANRFEDLLSSQDNSSKVLGLFSKGHMPWEADRLNSDSETPSLKEMVKYAIQRLSSNPKGYFLMVEGGRIDHASHRNMARRAFFEMLALDDAIGEALGQNSQETLVVLTADHETAGLSILGYGPHRVATGDQMLMDNIVDLDNMDRNHSIIAWGSGPGAHSPRKVNPSITNFQHRSVFYRESATHTAVDVPVVANGPGAFRFTGYYPNREIPVKIADSMGTSFTDKIFQQNRSVEVDFRK